MKKVFPTGYFFLLTFSLIAQRGNFFISDYQHSFNNLSYETTAITQDFRGQMYFGTPKGILRYDGFFWSQINTGYPINDLKNHGKFIFVAGRNHCGLVYVDKDGKEKYRSLISENIEADYMTIKVMGQKVYFISSVSIVEYDLAIDKITAQLTPPNLGTFRACFMVANQIFVRTDAKELWELKNATLKPTNIVLPHQLTSSFVFAEPLHTSVRTLIGTFDGHFVLFDGKTFQEIDFPDRKYLKNSILTDAKILNRTQIAFATFQGGVVLLNIKEGKTIELVSDSTQSPYINYQNGLQDNEIMALGIDRNHGIWVAHEYGYTRIDSKLPINRYDYYGLEGRILDIKTIHGVVYVATSDGVYYLDKADQVSIEQKMGKLIDKKTITVSKIVKRGKLKKHLNRASESSNKAVEILQKKSTKKKGLFAWWRKKKQQKKNKTNTTKSQSPKQKTNSQKKPADGKTKIESTEEKKGEKKKKKGFFSRLFKKKKKQGAEVESTQTDRKKRKKRRKRNRRKKNRRKSNPKKYSGSTKVLVTETIETEADPMLVLKKELVLKSVSYLFKKIPALAGKFKQLIPYKEGLLASGRHGIYYIRGTSVQKISSLETAYLYVPQGKEYLCATTFGEDFAVIFPDRKGKKTIMYRNLEDFLGRITQDSQGRIWVCGIGTVYRLTIHSQTGEVEKVKAYTLEGTEMEDIYPLYKGKKLYFVTLSKTYKYRNGNFASDTLLLPKIHQNARLITHSDKMIWASDHLEWYNTNGTKSKSLNILNCIPDLLDVITEDEKLIWVVNKNNKLYRVDLTMNYEPGNYDMFLDHVKTEKGDLLTLDHLEMDYDLGGLGFRFNMPDYFNRGKVEFRYFLSGKMKRWSNWNQSATVIFPPLEHGKYKLIVECRDAFGHLNTKEVKFRIHPPYWKTWWFMIGQILFFASLIGLTIWINKRFDIEGLVWVRRVITLLVLILCMEFIKVSLQSYFGLDGSSPVEDFGIEVFMALLIWPIERLLTHTIAKSKKS